MKKIIFAICILTVIGAAAVFLFLRLEPRSNFDKRLLKRVDAAFEPVDCPPVARTLPSSSYQGPMVDTHIHMPPIPDGPFGGGFDDDDARPAMGVNMNIGDYICMMNAEKTTKVFAFFPVWAPMEGEFVEVVRRTVETYPDRFVPFIMPPNHDDRADGFPTVTATELEDMLALAPGLFQGYGEIGLYERKGGAPELPPDSARLTDIYPVVRENKLLVYVHLGEGQKESFERVLAANPDITFIWHGDQLISYGRDGEQDLSAVEDILSTYPNARYGVDELYGDVWLLRPEVSKKEFLAHFANPEPLLEKDLATWKGFVNRHPDQVLWGTDRGWSAPWSVDPDVAVVLNNYARAFIGRLDPAVQEEFAYKNAEKLLSE